MKFVSLNMVERGAYDEVTGEEAETARPVVINTANVRCFYARKGAQPGTRITFADGGGFAVTEEVVTVARVIADLEVTIPAQAAE